MHLDELGIAAPCAQTLDSMQRTGDRAARFCSSCNERVVDLSRLTRREAEVVLRRGECVSAVYDQDGQLLFRPEPRRLPLFPTTLRAAAVAAPLWLMGCRDQPAPSPATEQSTRPDEVGPTPADDEPECALEALAPVAASAGPSPASSSVAVRPPVHPPLQRPPIHHRLGGKPAYRPETRSR